MLGGAFMSDIKLLKPEALANAIPDGPLSQHDILVDVLKGNVEKADNTSIQDVSASIGAGTVVTIQGFNSTTDKDDTGVLGPAPKTGTEELGPQLTLGTQAWLKYQVDAHLKASAGVDTSFLAADVEGGLRITLSDYHAHELTDNARQALRQDALHLRLATKASNLAELKVQDAMALQVRGFLNLSLEIKWSDVFTSNLSTLTRLLQSDTLLGLKTSVGATLSATATLKDDFLVIFSRPAAGRIRVGVSKAVSRGIDGSAKLGVDVQFKDPDAVKAVLTSVLEGLAGFTMAEVDELLGQAAAPALDAQTREKLSAFATRLGLEHLENSPPDLQEEWRKLQDEVRKTIEAIAKAKLTAGVTYEYLRVSTESTLLQAVLSDDDAQGLHPYFVKGDLAFVVDWMRKHDRQPEKYLNEKTLTQSSALGFSLGFGEWSLRSRSAKKVEVVTQKNFEGAERIAYVGVRSYEGDLFGLSKTKTSFDFKADMENFVVKPSATNLSYGLHLVMERERDVHSEEELRRTVDEAIVWRVMDEAHETEALAQLGSLLAQGQKVQTRVELKVDNIRVKELLPLMGSAERTHFAMALARSMPWDTMLVRSVVDLRERAYAPLWLEYLKKPNMSLKEAANFAYHELRKNPVSNDFALLQSERRLEVGIWSFAQLVQAQTSTAAKWQSFTEGARDLHEAIGSGKGHEAFRSTFNRMEDMCQGVPFQLKALGAWLLQLSARTPSGLSGIERTLTVLVKDPANNKEQQVLFTTSK